MHRFFLTLSRMMAWLGGAMLCLLIVLTCLSVLGRGLNGLLHGASAQAIAPGLADWLIGLGIGPVRGDFELVEAGVAFAIFAFLPLCQMQGGHATVDIFTARWRPRANRLRQLLSDAVFAAVLVLIAVQLGLGTTSKMATGQTTFLIQFPLWWAYALSLAGAVVAAFVALYVAGLRAAELWRGHALTDPDEAAP